MGAPKGNQNAARAHRWRDAIDRALERASRNEQLLAIDRIADEVVKKALEGDKDARREIGDRLDGKPAVVITGDTESGAVPIEIIGNASRL